jgi:pimeloyl-ACP methyl ester carboxylesterase
MKKQMLLAALGGGITFAVNHLAQRYRDDLDAAYTRLAGIERTVLLTRFGAVEYAESGCGEPLLSIHGSFGGCDAGLASLRSLMPPDRRVVAPSRFGYLGSSMPPGASPSDQADALADLLDRVGIDRSDVIAFSSGATSAIQLALRHPDRVNHLVVVSGNLPGAAAVATPPRMARLVYRDPIIWTLKVLARPILIRQIGVPNGYALRDEDERIVSDLLDHLFPVGPRVDGLMSDAYVLDHDIDNYPLEAVAVPTMFVHARDDSLVSYDLAVRAAQRVRGAQLVTVERGGHLMLGGHEDFIARSVLAFLAIPAYSQRVYSASAQSGGSGPGREA